ncbi:MAG: hypothetical protein KDE27_30225 [Planctomycetes bacterium]|nr:hypothetical protein [Planctomycetota bacterium]
MNRSFDPTRSAALVAFTLTTGVLTAQIPDRTDEFLHFPVARLGGEIRGIAVAPSGTVYTADGNPRLVAFDPATGARTTLLSGLPLSRPAMLRLGDGRQLTGNDLVLVDWNTEETTTCCDGRVFRIDPVTASSSVLASGNPQYTDADPYGVAFGPGGAFGDYLYVTDFQGATSHPPLIYRIDGSGVASPWFTASQWTTASTPRCLEFGTAAFGGDLFVTDLDSATIWRIDATPSASAFVTGLDVVAIAAATNTAWGSFLYVLAQGTTGTDLYRVDPVGNLELVIDEIPGKPTYAALAFRPDGVVLWVGVGRQLYQVVPSSLQLAATPNPVMAGQTLQVATTGGVPGKPALLVGDELAGQAFSPPGILALGTMNTTGSWTLQYPVTAALSGLGVRVQAVSLDGNDDYVASTKVDLVFQ